MNEFQNKIAKALEEKDALGPCPRCGKEDFAVVDAEGFVPVIKKVENKASLLHSSVPVAIIVCENCGYVLLHATKALGIEDDG